MAIFKCPKCNKTKEISKFRTYFKNGDKTNIDLDTKEEIYCECGTPMKFIPNEGNFQSSYSPFSTLSPLEKQQLLRKRSRDDAKKQKYIEQEREKIHFNA